MQNSRTRRTAWRAAAVAAAVAAASAASPATGRSSAALDEPAKVPLASADANVGRFTAYAGNYQLNISAGVARAALENKTAKAQAAFVDYGILAALLSTLSFPTFERLGVPAEVLTAVKSVLSFPTPAAVSTSGGASDIVRDPALPGAGRTALHLGPVALGTGPEEAHVASQPLGGQARASVGSLDMAGFAAGGGGVATASVDTNGASAAASVGELRFSMVAGAPPIAVFRGLEWHARQRRTDAGSEVLDAGFALGSAQIGPQAFHFDTPEQFAAAVEPMNTLLATLRTGLRIEAPVVKRSDGAVTVTPFAIDVRNSPLLESTFGLAWSNGLASVVTDAELAIAEAVPETGLVFTVANVVLGVAAGSGGVRLQFGGVSTSVGERDAYVPFDDEVGLDEEPPVEDIPETSVLEAASPAEIPAEELAVAVGGLDNPAPASLPTPAPAAPTSTRPARGPLGAVPATVSDPVASPWGVVGGALAGVLLLAALDELRLRRPARRRP